MLEIDLDNEQLTALAIEHKMPAHNSER
jgi:hypothetical protein